MDKSAGSKYDKTLLMLYRKFINELSKTEGIQHDRLINISDLEVGMTISRDLVTNEGLLLITKATKLNELTIRKLEQLQNRDTQQLNVFIKDLSSEEQQANTTA